MQSFELLSQKFGLHFEQKHFPDEPSSLYLPNEYFLQMGGKRIRPVCCLMGNELFDEIIPDAWHVATAIELFHNFTLIHDDIMDNAPLRRGMETLHTKFGGNTALLAGDVMLVAAYEHLSRIGTGLMHPIFKIFNQTAREVCEGQQLDMDFEKVNSVGVEKYLHMIEMKTSVLLAASLKMGAILGGAGERNQDLIYLFGKKLGIAFQVQDDYLDAFGDPQRFGKQVGGDIIANKKTFLMIRALEVATPDQVNELQNSTEITETGKVEKVLKIYRDCGVGDWALDQKNKYMDEAMQHLEDVAVLSRRKQPLKELAKFLVKRDH
jgi:geranylgeranyl diphosphate synthase type II